MLLLSAKIKVREEVVKGIDDSLDCTSCCKEEEIRASEYVSCGSSVRMFLVQYHVVVFVVRFVFV